MGWQAEALRERIADPTDEAPLAGSAAPWLSVALLRPAQRPEDVAWLWPRHVRGGALR